MKIVCSTALLLLAGASAAFVTTTSANAQCVQGWTVAGTSADSALNGIVQALKTWDPDGAGPLSPVIVATGSFNMAGGNLMQRITMWDGSHWQPFGSGGGISDGRSLAVRANGDLVVVGNFTTADSVPANRAAYWSQGGSAFNAFGNGVASIALTTNLYQGVNGEEVIAGGFFSGKVASWDGTSWNQMNGGVSSTVTCSATMANGDLALGGAFLTVNGGTTPALQVATWNGTTWSPLAGGIPTGTVRCMLALPNGHLIVGGGFATAGTSTVNFIAEWDGAAWHSMGSGMTGTGSNPGVYGLALLPNGDIVAGGNFDTAGGVTAHKVARWNGTSWAPMGATGMNGTVFCFTQLDGDLYAAGDFTTADGNPAVRFAKFASTTQAIADIGIQGGTPGTDGALNNNDFVVFIDYFFNSNPIADFGVQGGIAGHDGVFDNNDFVVYIDAFFTGCP
jgi:hypothetical protein